jgi:hypothetical protein
MLRTKTCDDEKKRTKFNVGRKSYWILKVLTKGLGTEYFSNIWEFYIIQK